MYKYIVTHTYWRVIIVHRVPQSDHVGVQIQDKTVLTTGQTIRANGLRKIFFNPINFFNVSLIVRGCGPNFYRCLLLLTMYILIALIIMHKYLCSKLYTYLLPAWPHIIFLLISLFCIQYCYCNYCLRPLSKNASGICWLLNHFFRLFDVAINILFSLSVLLFRSQKRLFRVFAHTDIVLPLL